MGSNTYDKKDVNPQPEPSSQIVELCKQICVQLLDKHPSDLTLEEQQAVESTMEAITEVLPVKA